MDRLSYGPGGGSRNSPSAAGGGTLRTVVASRGHLMLRAPPAMALPVVRIADIAQYENQEVELRGWLYSRRSSGKLHFLQLRDGSGTIQAVLFKGDVAPELFTLADHLGQETSLVLRGTV